LLIVAWTTRSATFLGWSLGLLVHRRTILASRIFSPFSRPLLGYFLKQITLLLPLNGHKFIVPIRVRESSTFDPSVFNLVLKDLRQAIVGTGPWEAALHPPQD
jgi:hypothetical protein